MSVMERRLSLKESFLGYVDESLLHPDTEPEAIIRNQRACIVEMIFIFRGKGFEPTAEQLSECCFLPVDIVKERWAQAESKK